MMGIARVHNPGFGMGSSPITQLCQRGNLPTNPSSGVDADWSRVSFASVSQAAALAAIQLRGRTANVQQQVFPPRGDAMGYMQRINYFSTVGIETEESFTRHDTSTRLVPITRIEMDEASVDTNGITTEVNTVISSHINLSMSVADNLNLSLGEFIDNVVQHSMAEAPGLACAQYYPSDGFVEVCVADCGIGVPRSMADNPAYSGKTDLELMGMAFERNTGQWYGRSVVGTERVSGGLGLSFASSLVRAIGGHIWAVSHDAAIHLTRSCVEAIDGLFYPGTLVVMRIPETMKEVTEFEMYGHGSDSPSRWNHVDGSYVEDDSPLW